MATKLYAEIRKDSKYYSQNDDAKRLGHGLPFPVKVESPCADWDVYVVKGGPGEQYRREDVHLYIKDGGKLVQVS